MTFADFARSADADPAPPQGLGRALQALWYDRRGQWDEAHTLAQAAGEDSDGGDGAWVHAYLHRKEGDPGNAGYWYRQAGKSPARGALPVEWEQITRALLQTDR